MSHLTAAATRFTGRQATAERHLSSHLCAVTLAAGHVVMEKARDKEQDGRGRTTAPMETLTPGRGPQRSPVPGGPCRGDVQAPGVGG